ncbi:MAG: 2-C-methyl-D-erythritol 4-phosphate cytidylyltransferase, partial [Acidobacteriota bacterium]
MRITAIIVAAGRGERFGGALPKQFQPVLGQPLLSHTLNRFMEATEVDDLVLVLPRASDMERHLGGVAAWPLPVQAVTGGRHRQDSVAAGLERTERSDLVLIHDGV